MTVPGGIVLGSATSDAGFLVLAIAALVLAGAAWMLVWRRGFQRAELRVGAVDMTLEAVAKQMVPNGGSSMRDAVDRIEQRVIAIDDRLTAVEEAVTQPSKEHIS